MVPFLSMVAQKILFSVNVVLFDVTLSVSVLHRLNTNFVCLLINLNNVIMVIVFKQEL